MNDYIKEDVDKVIDYYGFEYIDKGDYYILPTYCHNPDGDGSHKLYIYLNDNSVNLYCYTNCGSFDLVGLVMKYRDMNYFDAKNELDVITGHGKIFGFKDVSVLNPVQRIRKRTHQYEKIQAIDNQVMNNFYPYSYQGWIDEGISNYTQEKFGIMFDIKNKRIIIPQVDTKGNLIGVRQRSLLSYDIDNFGKYRPINMNGRVLRIPTGQYLYGEYQNIESIMDTHQVILFEGEKSVLKYDTMTNGNGNSLALSGSFISPWQVDELTKIGVNEIVVGLDKDYRDEREMELKAKIILKTFERYANRFNISVLFDPLDGELGYKFSPVDCGKDKFESLMRDRKMIIGKE